MFGVPALLSLAFVWSNYRYATTRTSIDTDRGLLTIEHERSPFRTTTKTVDLDDLAGVSVVTLGDAAMVRFAYRSGSWFSPPDVAVPVADLPRTLGALRQSRIPVGDPDRTHLAVRTPSPALGRVLGLSATYVGVPAVGIWLFGPSVLVGSDAAVIAWVMGAWTVQRHVTTALDRRPSGGAGVLLDVAVTAGSLLVIAVVGVLVFG